MEEIFKVQKEFYRTDLPQLAPGDIVKITQKVKIGGKERTQDIQGIIIKLHKKRDLDATFSIRWIASNKVGVEKTFPLHSPMILKIEKIKSVQVRRAKLYYLRSQDYSKLKQKKTAKKNDQEKKSKTGENRGKSSPQISAEKGSKNPKK